MENNDLLTINLRIFEKGTFPLTIPREKEEIYRKAADLISSAIQAYRKQYQLQSLENLLTMVAINFALKNLTMSGAQDLQPLLDELKTINKDLQLFLDDPVSK
jgi:cell division protein ZapA